MVVKRKVLYIIAVLCIGMFIMHACTSYYDSITGQMEIVTYSQSQGGGETGGTHTVTPLKIPDTFLSDLIRQHIEIPVEREPEFVPGEIIVKYKPGLEPADIQHSSTISAFIEYRTNRHTAGGIRSVLKLADYESSSLSENAVRDKTLQEIEWLNTQPHVDYAQPNYIYRPLGLASQPNDEYYYLQWHYPLIKWDHVWAENHTELSDLSDVIVAVIDTGIIRDNFTKGGNNHEDFGGSGSTPFVYEADFISNPNLSFDGDGFDYDATDMGDNPDLSLASFHGTHVAGTIGAYTDNTTGVAGMAGRSSATNNVKIMPLRALGYGGGTTVDIVDAIEYASKTGSYSSWPHDPADIINMSLGGTGQDTNLKNAIDAAYAQDIVIVAAAGNSGSNVPFYPASYTNVISVSAVEIGANIASYSNFGSTIDVAAPGGDLSTNLNFDIDASTYPDGVLSTFTRVSGSGPVTADTTTYAFNQGTSMATPHVAGLAALIKAADPSLTAAQIKSIIETNAIDLGSSGRDDYYGHGLINAYASVHDALNTPIGSQDPVLFPYPKLFKLQGSNPSSSFTLENIGNTTPNIGVSNIVKKNSSAWLTVSPTTGTVTASGLTIDIDINSSSIADGNTYIDMLTIEADAGVADEHVYVMYNVNGFPLEGLFDIGTLYVVAIDFETDAVSAVVVTTYSNQYRYAFKNLASGSYIIGASTDRDGDGVVFESNDAFGFYISTTQLVPIDVTAREVAENIDFQVIDQFENPTGQATLVLP
jgi:serine protease